LIDLLAHINSFNQNYKMKDTYLTSEDELFYLISLMMVEEDVLELPLG